MIRCALPDWATLHRMAILCATRSNGGIQYRELMHEWAAVYLRDLALEYIKAERSEL